MQNTINRIAHDGLTHIISEIALIKNSNDKNYSQNLSPIHFFIS